MKTNWRPKWRLWSRFDDPSNDTDDRLTTKVTTPDDILTARRDGVKWPHIFKWRQLMTLDDIGWHSWRLFNVLYLAYYFFSASRTGATFHAHPTYFSTNHLWHDVSHKGDTSEILQSLNFVTNRFSAMDGTGQEQFSTPKIGVWKSESLFFFF